VSPLDSTEPSRGIYVQKPKSDIYTAMLGVALGAIAIAILFLALEINRYGWNLSGS
jgi:hypothetical protein